MDKYTESKIIEGEHCQQLLSNPIFGSPAAPLVLTGLEVCIDCDAGAPVARSVRAACNAGASTVELCAAMSVDGITPALEQVVAARRAFGSRSGVMVMVRPRDGSFVYSPRELALMQRQIAQAAGAGADGVVFGVLAATGDAIAGDALQKLLATSRSYGLRTTFHRAFDAVADRGGALEQLIDAGVDRVLTSGTPWGTGKTAAAGIDNIKVLLQQAGGRIELVVGGGVNAANLVGILQALRGGSGRVCVHVYSAVRKRGSVCAGEARRLVELLHSSALHMHADT